MVKSDSTTDCTHRWLVGPLVDGSAESKCKLCGEVKSFFHQQKDEFKIGRKRGEKPTRIDLTIKDEPDSKVRPLNNNTY